MGSAALEMTAVVVAAGASTYEGVSAYQQQTAAANIQTNQIETQEATARSAAAEDQIKRDDQLSAVQSQQKASAAANGMALDSGSFVALQENSYNNFAEDTNIANMNLQIMKDQSAMQKDATQAQLQSEHTADWTKGIIGIGSAAFGIGQIMASPTDAALGATATKTATTATKSGLSFGQSASDANTLSSYMTGQSAEFPSGLSNPYQGYTGYKGF